MRQRARNLAGNVAPPCKCGFVIDDVVAGGSRFSPHSLQPLKAGGTQSSDVDERVGQQRFSCCTHAVLLGIRAARYPGEDLEGTVSVVSSLELSRVSTALVCDDSVYENSGRMHAMGGALGVDVRRKHIRAKKERKYSVLR